MTKTTNAVAWSDKNIDKLATILNKHIGEKAADEKYNRYTLRSMAMCAVGGDIQLLAVFDAEIID